MSTPANTVRHRNVPAVPRKNKDASPTSVVSRDSELEALTEANLKAKGPGSEWDYKLAIGIITALAFLTRFWGISHPNEVVFDEVHFGKVWWTAALIYPHRVYSNDC
jgi:dolichyl-phosphate-mannose-protein mannosyltransferase